MDLDLDLSLKIKARILKIFKKSRFSKEALKNQNKTKHFRFTVRYQDLLKELKSA